MTPRRRSSKKRGWPDNLYEDAGYFSWKHPTTKRHFGLGRDRAAAFTQATEANLHVEKALKDTRLVHRLTGDDMRTVKTWAIAFDKLLAKRKLSANTRSMYSSWLKRFRSELGDATLLAAITPLEVQAKLSAIAEATPSAAQQLRGFWNDIFREAELAGWIPKNENPIRDTRSGRHSVKRARLQLDVFMRVYTQTTIKWLPKAMALALVSGQRRENVAPARAADVRDGCWWVDQGKTGARVAIPLELRLDDFGMSLGEVIKSCRATGVLSKYLVHQTERHGKSRPGSRISLGRITEVFTAEIAALGIDWGDKTPPTFHEIRSLAERLYKRQGGIDTKELLGHKNARTTEIYDDPRGEWVRVKVGTV